MKKFIWILPIIFLLTFNGRMSFAIDVSVETGFQFDWWKDSSKNVGYQAYIPLKISSQISDFSLSLLGGYAYTNYAPTVGEGQSLSHTLDTKINLSYEILNLLPFDVLLGLDFNLPTGKTPLQQKDLVLIMDPDLVSITKFGEGFNINPTLTIAKEWGDWTAGVGIGYVWRGEYDFTTELQSYDPGDIITATAAVRYDFSLAWSARLFGQYAWYDKDQVQNHDYYQEGDFFLVGGGLRYSQKSWNAAFTLSYIFRGKSEFQDASGTLVPSGNTNYGDEWIADVLVRFLVSNQTTLWARVQGLYIQENGFPSTSPFYVGRREKGSLELGGKRAFGQHLDAGLAIRGFLMHDDESQYPQFKGETDYRGFSVIGNVTARF
jgi:hypothetical protein